MGNMKFKLSDMMPNSWFYKLKYMSSSKRRRPRSPKTTTTFTGTGAVKKQPCHHLSHSRKSYHVTRETIPPLQTFYNSLTNTNSIEEKITDVPDSVRKSTKQSIRKIPRKFSSVSSGCKCGYEYVWTNAEFSPEHSVSITPESRSDESLATQSFDEMVALSSSCVCKTNSTMKLEKKNELGTIPEFVLAPIHTNSSKFNEMVSKIDTKESKKQKTEPKISASKKQSTSPVFRNSGNSPGIKLRVKSPRIGNLTHGRKSVSFSTSSSRRSIAGSFAVVKSSFNPQRDFMESMVDMIVEYEITASKDLEGLLACYLLLNSDEYHDLIIKVFKQIWFDLYDHQ